MADIAQRAGVDRSTVSLALRQQPRISETTRARVIAAAAALGYTPDPLLGAFNLHRLRRRVAPAERGIAFVSDFPARRDFDASALHSGAFAGAKSAAARFGLSVSLFLTGPGQLSAPRLDQVLRARGVPGVLVGAFRLTTATLPLSWAHYSAIAIQSFHLQPRLDSLAIDYRTAARAAVERLGRDGHRRIGFLSDAAESARLQHQPLAGYLLEQAQRGFAPVPPLLLADATGDERTVTAWIRRHRLTAVLVGAPTADGGCPAGAGRKRNPVTWAGLFGDAGSARGAFARLGGRAIEHLALLLQHGTRGVPAAASTVLLPAVAEPPAGATLA
jgi:DNA-binding LacI/PurR family transcriptional regulator